MDGFTLKITNPPEGAVLWHADFAENSFDYDPMADSGWLSPDETWEYPSDPLGCTTLRILVLDANSNVLLEVYNLGPIEDGNNYTFDCSTVSLIGPSILNMVVGVMMIVLVMGIAMKSMKGE